MIAKTLGSSLVRAFITLLIVTFGVTLLITLMPGDPAAIAAGDQATPEMVAQVRENLGLNDPVYVRFFDYLNGLFHGDLGESAQLSPGRSVASLVWDALPITLSLTLVAVIFAIVVSLPVGYFAAIKPNGLADRLVMGMSAVLMAIPPFVLGLFLISFFAIARPWLPALGYTPLSEGLWPWLEHLLLPGITLGTVSAAEMARSVRASFVDVLEQDYIRTADAKGMPRYLIVWKHAFKNAASPILIVLGLQVTRIIGGVVVVELIFAMPGIGTLAFNSVSRRDIPMMQGVVLTGAILVIVTNLVVEWIVAYLNPRSSHAQ